MTKRILRDYYKQSYADQSDNIWKMDILLETHNLLKTES